MTKTVQITRVYTSQELGELADALAETIFQIDHELEGLKGGSRAAHLDELFPNGAKVMLESLLARRGCLLTLRNEFAEAHFKLDGVDRPVPPLY